MKDGWYRTEVGRKEPSLDGFTEVIGDKEPPKDGMVFIGGLPGLHIDLVWWDSERNGFFDYFHKQNVTGVLFYWRPAPKPPQKPKKKK